jgi:hypothetical protein
VLRFLSTQAINSILLSRLIQHWFRSCWSELLSLKGEPVGLEQVDDGIWKVYFGPVTLGRFDETDIKGKTVPYITVKV